MNSLLSNDARLRCDFVDLYYTLYGSKRPQCVPIPEVQAMLKQFDHNERERIEREKDRDRDRLKDIDIKPVIKQEIIDVSLSLIEVISRIFLYRLPNFCQNKLVCLKYNETRNKLSNLFTTESIKIAGILPANRWH